MRAASRVLVAVLLSLVTVTAHAAGVLVLGVVTDPALQPLPGASVELVTAGKTVARAITAADGSFRFTEVPPGAYEVHVRLSGFRQTIAKLTVGTEAPGPLAVKLLVGNVQDRVEVAAEAPMMPQPGALPAPPPPGAIAGGAVGGVSGVAGRGAGGGAGGGPTCRRPRRSRPRRWVMAEEASMPRPTRPSTRTATGVRRITRCQPSRSTWTRRLTPMSAASSTKAGCRRPMRCASRN